MKDLTSVELRFRVSSAMTLAIIALSVVGYFIVGRKARARTSLLGYVTPVYAASSVILLVFVLVSGDALVPYSKSAWDTWRRLR